MNKLAEKVCFSERYNTITHKDKTVLLDTITNRSCCITNDQYDLWSKMYALKDNRESLIKLLENNKEGNDLLLYLLRRGLATLKPIEVEKNFTGNPASAYWGLTDSCNFRCRYCYASCEGIRKDIKIDEMLTLDQCYEIVDKVKDYGFNELVLTGGEPLLEPKVFKIAEYAREKGMYCGLMTNGSLVTQFDVEKFRIFSYIKISLDSVVDKINDAVRGEGTCRRIIEGIKVLRENDINVDIGTVITQYNKGQLREFIEVLYKEYGITNHTLATHIPLGRGSDSGLGCSFEEIKESDDIIMATKCKIQENNLCSVIQDVFYPEGRKNCCGMGVSEIFINEKADVYPCRMTYTEEYLLGNLLEENLKDILSRVEKINEKLNVDCIESCKDCEVKYLCGGGCRMFHMSYSGSMYVNHSDVCDLYKRQIRNLLLAKNGINPLE